MIISTHIFSLYVFFLHIQVLNIRNFYRTHHYRVCMVRIPWCGGLQSQYVQNVTTPPYVYE